MGRVGAFTPVGSGWTWPSRWFGGEGCSRECAVGWWGCWESEEEPEKRRKEAEAQRFELEHLSTCRLCLLVSAAPENLRRRLDDPPRYELPS